VPHICGCPKNCRYILRILWRWKVRQENSIYDLKSYGDTQKYCFFLRFVSLSFLCRSQGKNACRNSQFAFRVWKDNFSVKPQGKNACFNASRRTIRILLLERYFFVSDRKLKTHVATLPAEQFAFQVWKEFLFKREKGESIENIPTKLFWKKVNKSSC
jgi:hypothetical protein